MSTAVAYYRTSSRANVGADKDSLPRQQAAVREYAAAHGIEIVAEFYDAAVSGADSVHERPEFNKMIAYMVDNSVGSILVENASRFARDIIVQITGYEWLKEQGLDVVPVDAPSHFKEDTPTATLVRNVLGAVSQFERQNLVWKLRGARERTRVRKGRCEGRKPPPDGA
ncbi:recombinase family protein, partial [Patescibacteria group bacterium]|nr:recombinase family protein [Patescibacteria group bacterium]